MSFSRATAGLANGKILICLAGFNFGGSPCGNASDPPPDRPSRMRSATIIHRNVAEKPAW
ncbi:MAG: hypothetical protein WA705_21855 [Candidatus Ozemobacteraceae bacterium]